MNKSFFMKPTTHRRGSALLMLVLALSLLIGVYSASTVQQSNQERKAEREQDRCMSRPYSSKVKLASTGRHRGEHPKNPFPQEADFFFKWPPGGEDFPLSKALPGHRKGYNQVSLILKLHD